MALTECEHASGKCDNDTDNVLREKAWIVLELQVGVNTYIRVNKVITVRLWYYLEKRERLNDNINMSFH